MKKWLLRLSIIFVSVIIGGVTAWWLLSQNRVNENKTSVTEPVASENLDLAINNQIKTTDKKTPVYGREILGFPEFCADKLVSVSGCDGQTDITTEQGNTYQLIEIGDQCWFVENSKEIPTTKKGWYGYYDNAEAEPSRGEGLLYTWDAAMNGETHERARGVCPEGWHIPSDCEWMALELQLGVLPQRLGDFDRRDSRTRLDNLFKTGYSGHQLARLTGDERQWFSRQATRIWTSSKDVRGPIVRGHSLIYRPNQIDRFHSKLKNALHAKCLSN